MKKNFLSLFLCIFVALFLAANALASHRFAFTVQKGAADPLPSVPCYVFSEGGAYLGLRASTDSAGRVSFDLADGV